MARKPIPALRETRAPFGFTVDNDASGRIKFEAIFPTDEAAHISLQILDNGKIGLMINGGLTAFTPRECDFLENALCHIRHMAEKVYTKPRRRL